MEYATFRVEIYPLLASVRDALSEKIVAANLDLPSALAGTCILGEFVGAARLAADGWPALLWSVRCWPKTVAHFSANRLGMANSIPAFFQHSRHCWPIWPIFLKRQRDGERAQLPSHNARPTNFHCEVQGAALGPCSEGIASSEQRPNRPTNSPTRSRRSTSRNGNAALVDQSAATVEGSSSVAFPIYARQRR